MKITRDNYEIYFMDYLDGLLSPEETRDLKAFLLINSDLEELFQETENFRLPPCPEHFPDKASLKKDPCHECPDYYAIAAAENELSEKDKKVLGKRVHISTFQSLVKTYVNLKLKPDAGIYFEKKKSLYRKDSHKAFVFRVTGFAAGICILFGLSFLWPRSQDSFVTVPCPEIPAVSIPLVSAPVTDIPKTDITPASGYKNTRRITKKQEFSTQREWLDTNELRPINIPPVILAQAESYHPRQALELILKKQYLPEIYLRENANNWKHSGTNVFSENIVTSVINTGREFTENIKQKIAIYRGNKSSTLFVIR